MQSGPPEAGAASDSQLVHGFRGAVAGHDQQWELVTLLPPAQTLR